MFDFTELEAELIIDSTDKDPLSSLHMEHSDTRSKDWSWPSWFGYPFRQSYASLWSSAGNRHCQFEIMGLLGEAQGTEGQEDTSSA
jgi:hypothetical protein